MNNYIVEENEIKQSMLKTNIFKYNHNDVAIEDNDDVSPTFEIQNLLAYGEFFLIIDFCLLTDIFEEHMFENI